MSAIMSIIDIATRRPYRPTAPVRALTVVKCDDQADRMTSYEQRRYVARNLEDAIDAFRAVFGPEVCASLLECQARNERQLKASS